MWFYHYEPKSKRVHGGKKTLSGKEKVLDRVVSKVGHADCLLTHQGTYYN